MKLPGLFLLLFLTVPFAGTCFWLQYHKKQVKKEVKTQLNTDSEKKELVLLKFSGNETKTKLRWEHSKEFEYRGEMYDVYKTRAKGDSIFYWCWWDRKETEINKQLYYLVVRALGNNPQNKDRQKRLVDFLKSLYYSDTSNRNSVFYPVEKTSFFFFSVHYLSLNKTPPSPPPEIV